MTYDETVYDRGEPRRRKNERPAPRPLDALESQVAVIDALNSDIGGRIIEATVTSNLAKRHSGGDLREWAVGAAREVAGLLDHATTVVVTDRMLSYVLDRMESIPYGDPIEPDDLLFESAYIVFPRAIEIGELVDDDLDNYPPRRVALFDAGYYLPRQIETPDPLRKTEVLRDGIMYTQSASTGILKAYADETRADGRPEVADDIDAALEDILQRKMHHIPIYSSGIAFGVPWDPELREEDFVLTSAGEFERRFWLSLLRTLKEEIFAPVRFKRADYRRATRRGLIPDVVVAELRRVKHRSKEELLPTGETVMWSHRWRRRGFVRTYHRGTDKEFKGWVRETICGPKSMPLIEKDRVYRLSK